MSKVKLLAWFEKDINTMAVCLKPGSALVLTPGMVRKIRQLQNFIIKKYLQNPWHDILYVVWYVEQRYQPTNLHLDIDYLHSQYAKQGSFDTYLSELFDVMYLNYVNLNIPVINCSILNKYVSGISKEFFLLNDICFLQHDSEHMEQINVSQKISKLLFSNDFYKKNHHYFYKKFDLKRFKNAIDRIDPNRLDQKNIISKKKQFDELKINYLSQLRHRI